MICAYLTRDFFKTFKILSLVSGKNILCISSLKYAYLIFESFTKCSFFKFSFYLSGSTSSLTPWSNLLYLLRKYKITSTKNTNAVMQPTALPNIIVMLLHLYSISVLSSISVLGVESKLNRFLLFIF